MNSPKRRRKNEKEKKEVFASACYIVILSFVVVVLCFLSLSRSFTLVLFEHINTDVTKNRNSRHARKTTTLSFSSFWNENELVKVFFSSYCINKIKKMMSKISWGVFFLVLGAMMHTFELLTTSTKTKTERRRKL